MRRAKFALVLSLLVGTGAATEVGATNALAAPITRQVAADHTRFEPVSPTRVVDTRSGTGGTRLTSGQTLEVPLAGGAAPAEATAVAINLTATDAVAPGYLTAWPCGEAVPATSTVNYVAGEPSAIGAMVGLGGGSLCIYAYSTVDIVLDLYGWFGPPDGARNWYLPMNPIRLVDTRYYEQTPPPGFVVTVPNTISLWVSAAAVNVTVSDVRQDGYVTVYPCDGPRPTTSNLNVRVGETRSNLAVVSLTTEPLPGGQLCVFLSGGGHLMVDVVGVFMSSPLNAGFTPLSPMRLLDTRATTRLTAGRTVEVEAPTGAAAVALSVVATEPDGDGYLTVVPCGTGVGDRTSTLNYSAGQTVGNGAVSLVGSNGKVCVFSYATTHVVVDLTGVFTYPEP